MPKPTKGARLGGSASHQKHILANLAGSLFEHGKITTTEAKAKKLRPYAEKLITHAKNGSLAARREVLKDITNKDIVHTLFSDVAPSFSDRNGGYTRIIKVENRKGDNAPMAVIELVKGELVTTEASRAARVAASRTSKTSDKNDDHSADADSDTVVPTSSDADTDSTNTEEAAKDSTDSGTDEDQANDVSTDS